jgi:hypothetical protein
VTGPADDDAVTYRRVDPDAHPEHTTASLAPTSKVIAGGTAGASTVLLLWLVSLFGLQVPPEVAAAVTVLLTAGAAYLKPERRA